MMTSFSNLFLHAKNKTTLFFAFFLIGCQMSPGSDIPPASPSSTGSTQSIALSPAVTAEHAVQNPHSEKYETESEKLQQCQSQLEALKVMSPAKYTQMRNSFDYLMNGAAQYSNIRQKINADTQDTVDALYRYRANLLCAQIAQTLLDGLTRRGEARP